MPKPIETDRLFLRPFDDSDFTFLRALHSNPEVMKFIGSGSTRTEEQTRISVSKTKEIARRNPLLGAWVAELKSTQEKIGNLIIREPATEEKTDGLEIGYSFMPEHWGKGYATEASQGIIDYARSHFGDIRIVALIEPTHSASRRTLEKLGFVTVAHGIYIDPTNGIKLPTEVLELRSK